MKKHLLFKSFIALVTYVALAFNISNAIAQAPGGTISGYQTVCGPPNDPFPLNNNIAASAGSGAYSWQKSEDNGLTWMNITGAVGSSYDPPAGLTVTTKYRRAFSQKTWPYAVYYSNTVIVSVCTYYNNYNSAGTNTCAPNAVTQVNTGVSISNGMVQFDGPGDDARLHTQHGITLTNAWRLNFNFNYSSFTFKDGSSPRDLSRNLIALTATNGQVYNNPGVFAMLEDMTPAVNDKPYFQLAGSSTTPNHYMDGWRPDPNTEYYISVYYINKTLFYIAYSDADRTQKVALFAGSVSYTGSDPNVQVLPYMQQGGKMPHDGGKLFGSLDNSCLSNLSATCAGTISGNTTIACGSTAPITLSSVSAFNIGGSISFSYSWEYFNGTSWVYANNGSNASLTINTPPTVTTKYRRRVYITVDHPYAAQSFYFPIASNEVTVTVASPLYSVQETQSPGSATFRFIPSGTGTYIEHSTNNSTWTTSGNAGDGSYTINLAYPHTRDLYIRAKHPSCGTGSSDFYHLTVENGFRKTGVENNLQDETSNVFSVSPNPSNGIFTLTVPHDQLKDVYVYDVMGKVVFTKNEVKDPVVHVDISGFPKGSYLIKIISEDNCQVRKVMVE